MGRKKKYKSKKELVEDKFKYFSLLDGEINYGADMARELGVSKTRVGDVLNTLTLKKLIEKKEKVGKIQPYKMTSEGRMFYDAILRVTPLTKEQIELVEKRLSDFDLTPEIYNFESAIPPKIREKIYANKRLVLQFFSDYQEVLKFKECEKLTYEVGKDWLNIKKAKLLNEYFYHMSRAFHYRCEWLKESPIPGGDPMGLWFQSLELWHLIINLLKQSLKEKEGEGEQVELGNLIETKYILSSIITLAFSLKEEGKKIPFSWQTDLVNILPDVPLDKNPSFFNIIMAFLVGIFPMESSCDKFRNRLLPYRLTSLRNTYPGFSQYLDKLFNDSLIIQEDEQLQKELITKLINYRNQTLNIEPIDKAS